MNYKWILLGLGILLILLIIYKKRSSILGFFKPACPYVQSKKEEDFKPSIRPPDYESEPDINKEYIVFHTKCRFSSNFNYVELKSNIYKAWARKIGMNQK